MKATKLEWRTIWLIWYLDPTGKGTIILPISSLIREP